jgi:alpha-glucan,water dikinase
VLVQQVVPARYSFVLHTTNPVSNDPAELYGELVFGLGETLVGAYPGRALSFSAAKDGSSQPALQCYPSKPGGLFLRRRSLIFRSDSNGEDLEGFAGAGLYDSVTAHEPQMEALDYESDELLTDDAFRARLLALLRDAGVAVERAMGGRAQDVEGVVTSEGDVFIVQTRPQV